MVAHVTPTRCAMCRKEPEAAPGVRLCYPCLQLAAVALRELRAKEPPPPAHITAGQLTHWAAGAVADVKQMSPVAHLLRGLVQGLVMAEEAVRGDPDPASIVRIQLVAMQALQEQKTW
jgi:hypothetical protein